MKKKILASALGLSVLAGCGTAFKDSRGFIPNKAPVVTKFDITYAGIDQKNYDSTKLYSGMPFLVTIDATDPENGKLTYDLSSSHSVTFSTWSPTSTGMVRTLYLGAVAPNNTVTLTLTVTDQKNASYVWTKTIGTGKSGAKLSVTPPDVSVINPKQTVKMEFSSDSVGTYRVYCDNSIADAKDAVLGTSGLSSYDSDDVDEKVEKEVTLFGPDVTGTAGISLTKDVKNYVWVVFKDKNDIVTTAWFNMYVEGTLPRIVSTTPDTATVGVDLAPTISIQFNKTIALSSLVKDNFVFTNEAGDPIDYNILGFDDATHILQLKPVAALVYNTKYTVKAVKALADEAGNAMLDDYFFTFTTIEEGMLSVPELSPPAGIYSDTQTVTLKTNDNDATICYTTDDTVPSVTKKADSSFDPGTGIWVSSGSTVSVAKGLTLRALAFKTGKTATKVCTAAYTLKPAVPVFAFDKTALTGEGNLTISSPTSGATIYYTIDGTDPLSSASAKILGSGQTAYIYQTMTVRSIAKKDGYDASDETQKEYPVKTAAPVFVPGTNPTLSDDTEPVTLSLEGGASCWYTIAEDGAVPADPTTGSTLYSGGIKLTGTANGTKVYTVKALAKRDGKGMSDIVSCTFTLDFTSVGTVSFTRHPSGDVLYAEDYEVVSCSDSAATISCTATVGGVDTVYKGTGVVTVPIAKTTILNASANKGKKTAASIGPVQVTLKVPTPTINRVTLYGISYYSIFCSGATLYYTINGDTPTSSSTAYASNFNVPAGTTVKAIGCRDGWTESDVSEKEIRYIEYSGNGYTPGEGTVPARLYCENGDIITLENCNLFKLNDSGSSYKGIGWNTNASASTAGSSPYTVPAANTTFYAVWKGLSIGDVGPGGGYVFYINDAITTAAGYTASGWKYMETVGTDLSINFAPDSNTSLIAAITNLGALSQEIGSGVSNMETLVSKIEGTSGGPWINAYAAKYCSEFSRNGKNDWFLPSYKEAKMMVNNLYSISIGNIEVNREYWSSSTALYDGNYLPKVALANNAYGYVVISYRTAALTYVRPVRRF